jgi:hypothetical protein
MKKIILTFIVGITLLSCGVKKFPASTELLSINIPAINTVNSIEIGVTLLSKENGFKHNAIKIVEGRKTKFQSIIKDINEGDVFINEFNTSKYALYNTMTNKSFGVAIPFDGKKPLLFTDKGVGISFLQIREEIKYVETSVPIIGKQYVKQEFIYNGRIGNAVKFIYREYLDDYARPAFTQDLQYDLSESNIIGFLGLRIEVIKATNTNIEYKVISLFNKN